MNKSLRIYLLGSFEVQMNGVALTSQVWQSQQTQMVAKNLLTNRGKVVKSDQLIDILWPNDPPEAARRRLHVRISQLRNGFGEKNNLIRTVQGGYVFELDESCWLDVDEFLSQITEGQSCQQTGDLREAINAFERARQAYRGHFLAEDLYEDWTFSHRESFKERFINLLIELSECYAQQGRYRLAITRVRQALSEDPVRETIYTRLILYHYYAGERAQALSTFDRCSEILQKELGVKPLYSTKNLIEQIRAGTLWKNTEAPRYPPPIYDGRLFEVPYALNEIPFVSREREYAWLVSQWNDPAQPTIMLEGEAGIGKSRLVEVFTGYMSSQGARVLHVHLGPSSPLRRGAVVAALSSLLTQQTLTKLSPETLAALAVVFPDILKQFQGLPTLPPLSSDGERQRLFQAISDLGTATTSTPTLIVVDDAQRLSENAMTLLAKLRETFRVLLSFRSEETPPDHSLRAIFKSTILKLNPLSRTAIRELIRQLSGEEHLEIASQLSDLSEGVPLFVVALLQYMFENGHLFINASGHWEVITHTLPALPETLRATIEARLNYLNRAQRRILDFAVVLGGEFDFTLLQSASQLPEDRLLTILDELMDAAMLSEPRSLTRPEFTLTHDRYLEVAYDAIPPVRRKGMHLQAAQAMEMLYDNHLEAYFSQLADHYDKAKQPTKTVHYATLAGKQAAAQFASMEALHYFERALALLPPESIEQQAELYLAREETYDLLGMRPHQNEDLTALEALRSQLPPPQQAEVSLRRAAYAWILGDNSGADAALIEAIEIAQACGAEQVEARALLLAGRAALDQESAIRYLQKARKLAKKIEQRALEGDIVRCLGNAAYWQNQFQQSQAYLTEALEIHQEVGDLRGELSAFNNLGLVDQISGEPEKATQDFEAARKICLKIGDRLAEGVILTNLGGLGIELGRYAEAKSWLEQAIIIRGEIGNEEGLALALNHLGQIHRLQGQYDMAQQTFSDALVINLRIQQPQQTSDSYNGLSILSRELGDYPLAQEYLMQSFDSQVDQHSPHAINALINASLLSTLYGNPAEGLAKGQEALSLSVDLPQMQAGALKNMGHALLGLQREEEAQERYEKARSIYDDLDQSHLAVEPLAGLAQVALAHNDEQQALSFIEAILPIINAGPLEGPDRVLWVYWTCYQAITRVEDPRADHILTIAYAEVQARAESIEDQDKRQSFLATIPENIRIEKTRGTLEIH